MASDTHRFNLKMRHHPWRKLKFILGVRHRIRQPLFVLGVPRSNTTFFARCLSCHSQLTGLGGELNDVWERAGGFQVGYPTDHLSASHYLTEGDVDDRVKSKVRRAFEWEFWRREQRSGTRMVHHNPHLSNKLRLVHSIFPDAALVVTTRDIRSTVASTKKLWDWVWEKFHVKTFLPEDESECWTCIPAEQADGYDPSRLFPGGSVTVLAEHWIRMHRYLEKHSRLFKPCMWVRHRDFLRQPHQTLQSVYQTVQLPDEPCPLLDQVEPNRNSKFQSILTHSELFKLDQFIANHRDEIHSFDYADTLVENAA